MSICSRTLLGNGDGGNPVDLPVTPAVILQEWSRLLQGYRCDGMVIRGSPYSVTQYTSLSGDSVDGLLFLHGLMSLIKLNI
jgi:hypothetical protein